MKKITAFPGRILFDHIPKTGGTAVANWFTEALGTGCVSPQLNGIHKQLINRYGGKYSVISAHVDFELEVELDPRYCYITCLRHPVDRALSWIYFVLEEYENQPDNPLYLAVVNMLKTEGEVIDSSIISNLSNLYINHYSKIGQIQGVSKRYSIDHCINVLKQYDLVGFQEDMEIFIDQLAMLINAPQVGTIEKKRISSKRPSYCSPALKDKLIKINQLDILLYEEVYKWKNQGFAKACYALPWQKYDVQIEMQVRTTSDLFITKALLREGPIVDRMQSMTFQVDFFLARGIKELGVGIDIYDSDNSVVFGTNNIVLHQILNEVKIGAYSVAFSILADLPVGKYTAGCSFMEVLKDGGNELSYNSHLFEFEVRQQIETHYSGYLYLPSKIIMSQIEEKHNIVQRPVGSLNVLSSFRDMKRNEKIFLEVAIKNQGIKEWRSDDFRRVNMAFRWADINSGETIIDGARTKLTDNVILPMETIIEKILIVAPPVAGEYLLIVTLVQENVGWFDCMGDGFNAYKVEVKINE